MKAITQQFPELRTPTPVPTEWSFAHLGAALKEQFASLDLKRLLFSLDSPVAVVKGKLALKWLVKTWKAAVGEKLPFGLVFQAWKNPGEVSRGSSHADRQLMFLHLLMDADDVYSFSTSPSQIVVAPTPRHV